MKKMIISAIGLTILGPHPSNASMPDDDNRSGDAVM